MRKICKENLAIKPFILPRNEAVKLMEERQEHYKICLLYTSRCV